MYIPCFPYLAYFTTDLNPASWAALIAQFTEHWTSNPVVMSSNPVRGSSVYFSLSAFGLCLKLPCLALPCLPLRIHVQDLIMCIQMDGVCCNAVNTLRFFHVLPSYMHTALPMKQSLFALLVCRYSKQI